MRKIILLCFVFSVSVFAQNSGKISGTIVDAKTNEPIPSVNVVVRGTSLGAVTDIDGLFFILNVPPGVYDLSASMIGYQGMVQQKIIVNINRTTTVNFSLQQMALEGQEVIVTAERPDVEREKTSTSEIRRGEDVMTVPGMQDINSVLTLSSDISDGHFRGGRDNEELYNLQGMGIMDPLNNSNAFNPIMSAVEEVEVITSGFSAQYGNAQSGIVNITMKEGKDKWQGRVELRARMPGRKHWGPSMWDPVANPYLQNLDTYDEWLKGNPNTTNNTPYWGSVGSGFEGRYSRDTATLVGVRYTSYLFEERRDIGKDYDNLWDHSNDVTVGGPLASNVRLFLALHTTTDWSILPTAVPNDEKTLMGNVVFDFGSGMTLRVSGAYDKNFDYYISGRNGTGWYNWTWNRELGTQRNEDEKIQLGVRWTQALSNSTFYEIKLNTLNLKHLRGSPVNDPTPSEGSRIWSLNFGAVPDGFNYGAPPDDFSNERTGTISLDASLTSQASTSHMLLTGIQANWFTIDINNISSTSSLTSGSLTKYYAKPYEFAVFVQDKMEFQGMIANIGLRLDAYNDNVSYFTNLFNPYGYIDSLGLSKKDIRYASTARTSLVARLQPRAGFSFPVSTVTVFHVNYGTFLQKPPLTRAIYQSFSRNDLYRYGTVLTPGTIGNPQLKPEVTNSYDIGITQGLGEGFTLDVSGYYKDVRDLIQRVYYQDSLNNQYTSYMNRDYADIRGFRVGLAKRRGMVTGTLNYTYGVATGKNSSQTGDQDATIAANSQFSKEVVPDDILMDFDRTHVLKATLGFTTNENWGPRLLGIYPFEQLTISALSSVQSGRPFSSKLHPGPLMKERTPTEYTTNMRITKVLPRFFGGNTATVYVEISNLFNDRIYDYSAVFNDVKYTRIFEATHDIKDIRYYEDDNRQGMLINQEFRIYSNQPRSWNIGLIINL